MGRNLVTVDQDPQRFRSTLDPFGDDLNEHFWEAMTDLREHCPVAHSDGPAKFWSLTRYKDIVAAAQDWKTFSSSRGVAVFQMPDDYAGFPVLESDPPQHVEWRHLLNPLLSPPVVARLEEQVRRIANEHIDSFVNRSSCDLAKEFARPVPQAVLFEAFLNVDRSELAQVEEWARIIIWEMFTSPVAFEADESLREWIAGHLAERRKNPGSGDFLDALTTGQICGEAISESTQIDAVRLLVFAGLDTTSNAIAASCRILADRIDIQDWLREDASRIPLAVEEFLRFDPPVTHLARQTTRDVEFGGRLIPAGEKVALYFSAANRDPREFDDPDELRFDRENTRHIAFGIGPHRCAGSHLARMEIRVALEQLLERIPPFQLTGKEDVEWYTRMPRGPLSVPVSFARSASSH
jgi:cytochrome P450